MVNTYYFYNDYKGFRQDKLLDVGTYSEWHGFPRYFIDGVCYEFLPHRIDGPAIITYTNGDVTEIKYCILGRTISEKQFNTPGVVDSIVLERS